VLRRAVAFALVLLCWGAARAEAQLPDSVQAAVDRYRALIRWAESGSDSGSLERAFAATRSLGQVLQAGPDSSLLESLSEKSYRALRHALVGVLVFREEGTFVAPDPDYFLKLAEAHGEVADRAFFKAYKATYPEGVWPVYVEQQTDYSGCTRFGSMSLVQTYGRWFEFRRDFPGRYDFTVREELWAVVRELEESDCACGDRASVESELRRFVESYPNSPERPVVEHRLEMLRSGRLKVREKCISG